MLLIIFGAGASYDCDEDTISISNRVKIPLANDLINKDLTYVQEAMTRWPGAVSLLNRLVALKTKIQIDFNLEEALYSELQRGNTSVQAQLLSFKFYIHDIIRNAERQVRSNNQGNTNYTALLNLLQLNEIDTKFGISLVTFNYDTLIDTACTQTYPTWEFDKFEDYISGFDLVKLYKPHGSLSWKQPYTTAHQPGRVGVIKALENHASFGATKNQQQIVNFFDDNPLIVQGNYISEPVLALPYREKTAFAFPDEHKQSLIRDMEKITHILTIGWRGTEKHFYNEILSKISNSNKIKILNVNPVTKDIEAAFRESILKDKIGTTVGVQKGFSEFLKNPKELIEFITS